MKRLTEMTKSELEIVQKKLNSDVQKSVDTDIENLVTSLDCPLNFGKYKGKTLEQLIFTDPQYLLWIAENCSERLSLLPKDSNRLNTKVLEMRIESMKRRKDEVTIDLGKLNKQLKELSK